MDITVTGQHFVLAGVALGYLLIILVTNRGFIAAPRYRLLLAQLDDCRERAAIMSSQLDPASPAAVEAAASITRSLDDLRAKRRRALGWLLDRAGWVFNVPLTKLAADLQQLNAVDRKFVFLVRDTELDAYAQPILARLAAFDPGAAGNLANRLTDAPTADAQRILIKSAHKLVHERENTSLYTEFEHQRIALWLAIVGLFGVVAVGVALRHEQTLLMGALGGFLAPVVTALTGRRVASSWGVMVLSPVGGALTAVGGLLLVRFLSDPDVNVLGTVFLDNSWDAPDRPVALALALLFGFSGRLFSSLAIAATSQLTRAEQARTEQPTKPEAVTG